MSISLHLFYAVRSSQRGTVSDKSARMSSSCVYASRDTGSCRKTRKTDKSKRFILSDPQSKITIQRENVAHSLSSKKPSFVNFVEGAFSTNIYSRLRCRSLFKIVLRIQMQKASVRNKTKQNHIINHCLKQLSG